MGGMDSVLIHNREMGPRDWAVDVAVALAAFAFGAVQLMVSASLILPDEALRRMLGIEAVVPATSSFIALALTTFPLVARRKSPWLVFVFTLVAFVGLQNSFHGSMLAVFGPMVALFTIVVECSRIEMGVACAASALGLAAATYGGTSAALWFWVYVQNLVLMVVSALGGLAVCAHRDSVRATEQRAEEAERTREEVAARRVEEERVGIAREATTNIVRHAHAKNASIVLESDGAKALLTVQDDGDGLLGAADGASPTGGHGIDGMRERAKLLGGTLDAGPLPGGGFRVRASIPVGDESSGFGAARGERGFHERR